MRWGDAGDSARQAAVLAALLDQMQGRQPAKAATIDVSAPGAVVLR